MRPPQRRYRPAVDARSILSVYFEHSLKVRRRWPSPGQRAAWWRTDDSRSAATRPKLVEAAIETLKARRYAGTSARAIAERAGLNQGLVFYHFGSVANLLLAALDSVSARRMEQYGDAVDQVGVAHGAGRGGDRHLPGGSRCRLRGRPRRDDRRGLVHPGVGPRGVGPARAVVRLRRAGGDDHARPRRWTRCCRPATWPTPSSPSTSGSRC